MTLGKIRNIFRNLVDSCKPAALTPVAGVMSIQTIHCTLSNISC